MIGKNRWEIKKTGVLRFIEKNRQEKKQDVFIKKQKKTNPWVVLPVFHSPYISCLILPGE